MTTITIEVESGDEAEVFSALAQAFGGEVSAPEPKKEKPKKEKPKKEKPKKEKAKKADKEEPSDDTTDDEEVTIDQVRTALAKKVNDHREEIKKKLTELEASNVTSLSSSKYGEFMEFLEAL